MKTLSLFILSIALFSCSSQPKVEQKPVQDDPKSTTLIENSEQSQPNEQSEESDVDIEICFTLGNIARDITKSKNKRKSLKTILKKYRKNISNDGMYSLIETTANKVFKEDIKEPNNAAYNIHKFCADSNPPVYEKDAFLECPTTGYAIDMARIALRISDKKFAEKMIKEDLGEYKNALSIDIKQLVSNSKKGKYSSGITEYSNCMASYKI